MVPYTSTEAYALELQRYEADIASVQTVLDEARARLKTYPVKKKGEAPNPDKVDLQRVRDNYNSRVKTARKRLKRLVELSDKLPLWYMVKFLSAARLELWQGEELEAWKKERKAGEGEGERPYRMRLGLPILVSNKDCDVVIPLPNGLTRRDELKKMEGRGAGGKYIIQEILMGQCGHKTYKRWLFDRAEEGYFKSLEKTDPRRDALATGEVPASLLFHDLPEHIRAELYTILKPSAVMKSYDNIILTASFGFLTVPKADFDIAFSLKTITKSGPKYTVKRSYIKDQLKKTLVSTLVDDLTDVAAQ